MTLEANRAIVRELESDSLTGEREQGTAYYSLLVHELGRFDHVLITMVCDHGVVRCLTYQFHDYLSGRSECARFANPGNGENRDSRFVFSKISELFARYRSRVRASPSEEDEYYDTLKDFVVLRLLQVVSRHGAEASSRPLVVHLTAQRAVLESHYLKILRKQVTDRQRRAGNLEFI